MRSLTRMARAFLCLTAAIIYIAPQTAGANTSSSAYFASRVSPGSVAFDPPGVPTQLTPLNGAYDVPTTVDLVFTTVDDATNYNVQVATDAAFNSIVYSTNVPAGHTSFTAPAPNTTYYWRVQAEGPGGRSDFSAPWSFSLFSEPSCGADVVNLFWPANGVYGIPLETDLEFTMPDGVDRFNVEVANDKYFNDIVYATNRPGSPVRFIAPSEGVYFWHVQSVGPQGLCHYSPTWWFSTLDEPEPGIDPPTLLTPLNGATGLGADLDLVFTTIDGGTGYNVQVANDFAFSSIIYSTNVPAGHTTFTAPSNGTFYWRAQSEKGTEKSNFTTPWSFTVGATGEAELSTGLTVEGVPASYALHDAYPNPFNPSTTIAIDVPEATHLKLSVYDALGHEVMQLASSDVEAGRYSYTVDASKLASGLYLYRIETPDFIQTKRMVLMK